MTRPWVTEAMCAEIRKKHELQDISFRTKAEEDFNKFKEQRTKVTNMLRAAKLEYIGSQDETVSRRASLGTGRTRPDEQ